MKIVKGYATPLSSLEVGSVFELLDVVYMTIASKKSSTGNTAMNLETGELKIVPACGNVLHFPNAKLVIGEPAMGSQK